VIRKRSGSRSPTASDSGMAKQALVFLLSVLVLLASQHCVAERAHLHTKSLGSTTVTYHHHHDDHGLADHPNTDSPERETDCGDSACFQRTSSAVTKIKIPQLDSRNGILAVSSAEERFSFKTLRISEVLQEYGASPPEQISPRILLGTVSAPNAPPRSLL
jgi:hypothetical protein